MSYEGIPQGKRVLLTLLLSSQGFIFVSRGGNALSAPTVYADAISDCVNLKKAPGLESPTIAQLI